MNETKRISFITSATALMFLFGIIVSKNLWLPVRAYPPTPVFKIFTATPWPISFALLGMLILLLMITALSRMPRKYIYGVIVLMGFFFLQDQGRLFPSFYEYFIFFIIISFYNWPGGENDNENASYVLNALRLAVICIYFWAGVQKINPLFINDLTFFSAPIVNAFPFFKNIIPILGIFAPFVEIWIAAGLLFKPSRNYALWTAIAMHTLIFFTIGPFRGNWNDSAWAWNLASMAFVFLLFWKAPAVQARSILPNKKSYLRGATFIVLGVLPLLSLFNMLDSSMAFDVYSGNYVQARITINGISQNNFPESVQKYISQSGSLDVYQWSADEFNANPYPAARVFQNIGQSLCNYATASVPASSSVEVTIYDRLKIFQNPASRNIYITAYPCNALDNIF